jgi:branched-chain amino acid transport system permease protein
MRFDYDTSYAQARQLLRGRGQWLAYGFLGIALLLAPFLIPVFYVGEMTYLFIMAVASVGLMMLTGLAGLVSLGHAAFLAIGAYCHVWLLGQGVPFLLSLTAAMAMSALAGFVIGLPAIRISGLYLAMVTLAFSFIVSHFAGMWESVTGGHAGTAVPDPVIGALDLSRPTAFYFTCLLLLFLVLLACLNLLRAPIGRSFVGARDSSAAAYALGIHVPRVKILAFVLSAAICGLSGALLAHHMRFVSPEAFEISVSLQLVLMVVIGGMGSLRGAVFGAVVIGLLPNLISLVKPMLPQRISDQSGLDIFIFGLILTLFVLFEPTGLNGRWLKLRAFLQSFPMHRRNTFKRAKAYMRSERHR